MKNQLPWIFTIGALLLIAFAIFQFNDLIDNSMNGIDNTITVTGDSTLNVDPDKAEIWLLVESRGNSAQTAQAALQLETNRLIDALKDEGLTEDDIETLNFNVNPQYRWDREEYKQVFEYYVARHSMKITVLDLDETGRIADVVGGENVQVQNIQFGLTDEAREEFDNEALEEAALEARNKAEILTEKTGAKLGKVISIEESDLYYPPFRYYAAAEVADMKVQPGPTEILPGDVSVSASVTVTYALR